jgi:hypothetical protein
MGSSSRALVACGGGECFAVTSLSEEEESALLRRFSTGEETEEVFRRLRPAGAYLCNDRRLFLSLVRLGLLLPPIFLGPRSLSLFPATGLMLLSLSFRPALRSLPPFLGLTLRSLSLLRLLLGLPRRRGLLLRLKRRSSRVLRSFPTSARLSLLSSYES